MSEELNLHSLKPAQPQKARKRIGRGLGSGKGRYSGRGIKGQKSRAGSHTMPAGFAGGQMPIHMQLGKLRGNTSKDALPIGPFRTSTQPVNVAALERFDNGTEVTPELLVQVGILKNTKIDVKILGQGDLTKKLTVTAHGFSASAKEKIEGAGGTAVALREPKVKKAPPKRKPAAETEDAEPETVDAVEAVEADAAPEQEASEE
jgi:large subunit ribosomal protein L15